MEYRCELCSRTFKSTQGLRGHMNWSHPETRNGEIVNISTGETENINTDQQLAQYVSVLSYACGLRISAVVCAA